MIQNILSATLVKRNLTNIIKKVETDYERFIITVRGHPKAVLLSYEDFENLQEELEILAHNQNFFKDRKKAHRDLKNGNTISLNELNKELGIEN